MRWVSFFIIYSYQPAHEDELDLAVDQVVDFLGEVEDGWWKGRSQQSGKVRLISGYVMATLLPMSWMLE